MSERIEELYEKAIEQITPNVLDEILAQDVSFMEEEDSIIQPKKEVRKHKKVSAIFSAVGVMAAAIILLFFYNRSVVETSITIDVNPSFEIQLTKQEKVKNVTGVNADAQKIIEQADFSDGNLDNTVEELIQILDKDGYFKDEAVILVSVENKKEEKAKEMEKKVKKQIRKACKKGETKKEPSIYTQSVRDDKEVEEISRSYHISKGRATFIRNMTKEDDSWEVKDLATKSVDELVTTVKEKGVKISDILKNEKDNPRTEDTKKPSQEKKENEEKKENDKKKENEEKREDNKSKENITKDDSSKKDNTDKGENKHTEKKDDKDTRKEVVKPNNKNDHSQQQNKNDNNSKEETKKEPTRPNKEQEKEDDDKEQEKEPEKEENSKSSPIPQEDENKKEEQDRGQDRKEDSEERPVKGEHPGRGERDNHRNR